MTPARIIYHQPSVACGASFRWVTTRWICSSFFTGHKTLIDEAATCKIQPQGSKICIIDEILPVSIRRVSDLRENFKLYEDYMKNDTKFEKKHVYQA